MNKTILTLLGFGAVLTCAACGGHAQERFSMELSGGIVRNNVFDVIQPYRGAYYLIEGSVFYELTPGGALLDFTGPIQLSLTTGFHTWMDPGHVYSTLPALPQLLRNTIDIPLLAGVRWQLTKTIVSPYVSAEFGIHYVSREYQDVVAHFHPGATLGFQIVSTSTATESVVRFGYRFGVGMTVSLSDNVQLDLGIRHDGIVWPFVYDRVLGLSMNGIKFVDVTLGVKFKF